MRKSIFSLTILFILCLSCVITFYYFFNTPSIDIPPTAHLLETNSICGSGYCTIYSSYNINTNTQLLITFYKAKGYKCFELSPISHAGRFRQIPQPYWQCAGKATPKGDAYIGFKDDGQMPYHTMHVFTEIGWRPTW